VEKLDLNEFDFLGIIKLKEVSNLGDFVEPCGQGEYLSRNKNYYSCKNGKQLIDEWNYLNSLLPCAGKKGFVITEQMLNCSSRAYYQEFIENLNSGKSKLKQAKKCLDNDALNVVRIFQGKKAQKINIEFPLIAGVSSGRFAEADNKKIIFESLKALPKQKFVISPLYGGVLIGPFFKAIQSSGYANVLFGMHDQQSARMVRNNLIDLKQVMSKEAIKGLPPEITIFDDNIGTGETLLVLKKSLESIGKKVKIGALEFSWDYFDQIMKGMRREEPVDFTKIDFPTFRSTRHHKITRSFIKSLNKGGNEYLARLKSLGFANRFLSDDELLYFRGKSVCNCYDIDFQDFSGIKSNLVLSVDIMNKKIRYMENEPTNKSVRIILDYPEVNIIDLDRYQGRKPRIRLIQKMLNLRPCRIGGGIRTKEDIKLLLKLGAEKVIVGTSASKELLESFPREKIVVAIDSIDRATGKKRNVPRIIKELEPYCDEFQYVCVETDGKAQGGDIKNAIRYSNLTKNKFNCVGGIAHKREMQKLAKHNIGCVVGRAIEEGYFG